jgi:hypothetical protein
MELDAITFRTLAKQLLPPRSTLSADEATAVVQIAELAIGVDLEEGAEELALLRQVKRHVCAIGGISPDDVPAVSPLPLDAEERRAWCAQLAHRLDSNGARELAYVLAYLCIAGDLELAPVESSLIVDLQGALDIDNARADELVEAVAVLATPGDVRAELRDSAPP